MLQMFGFGGAKCARCGHKNAADAQYCAQCGMVGGAPRNAPVLVDNRWVPAPDELAVFFGVRELAGLFVKTLRVPPTTRGFILQGDKATEVPQGEYEIEGFFSRLNHLLRDRHAEILVTRMAALPVQFELHDLPSAEHLKISSTLTVSIKIEQVSAFASHFMTMPGTVTTADLRELLLPSVRQIAAEFTGAQSLRDMARNAELRAQFNERLQGSLKLRLAQFGLAAVQVDTLSLSHERFDANRAHVGTLWLAADEQHARQEHARHLDELYNDEQWQAIAREEQESRLRLRRAEARQNEGIDQAGVTLENAERMHALRARDIELYGRIAESRNRKEALARGAADKLAELEHELALRGAARLDEAGQWEHLRRLAQLHMRTELDVAQQAAVEQRLLAQQRFAQQLLQQQVRNKIEQAALIEDASAQRSVQARLRASEEAAARNLAALDAEQQRAELRLLALAHAAREREAERSAEWDEELAIERKREVMRADAVKEVGAQEQVETVQQRIDALKRGGAQEDALAQHSKLLRTIEADGLHVRQTQQIALDGEQQRHALKLQQHEAEWQQQLRRMEHEREDRFAQLNHALELARVEIARAESMGAMSDTAKLALAAAPNAAALADFMKTQVHAGMSAEQLAALSGVVAAGRGVTPADVLAQAERERALRETQLADERRHQLDLLRMQNDVNKTALNAMAQSVSRQCTNGHTAGAEDRFCAICGAPVQAKQAS